MTFEKTLPVAEEAPQMSEIYSVEWWQSRSAEDLRDIIKRGFSGGAEFSGAVAESERRASEAMRRLRDAASVERRQRKRLTLYLALAVIVATVVGIASAATLFAS